MEIERIIGAVFSGFMCKLYAVGMALWVGIEACTFVVETFGMLSEVM